MKTFIHKEEKYNFSPLDVIERDNKRYYGKDGVYYPSMTTVLSEFPGKQEGLDNWRNRVGIEEAEAITYVAGNRGQGVHDVAEMYLNNEIHDSNFFVFKRPPINPDVVSMFNTLRPYLDQIDNIDGLEIALYSDDLEMAGRVDCIAEYNGELAIIDFKTSTKYKREEWIHDYFAQETAYAIMFQELTGLIPKKLVTIIACETGEPQIFEI